MKGLLIKDVRLMKNQKQFFLIVLVLWLFFAVSYDNPVFSVAYITTMFSFYTLSTLSYDTFENGIAYLFTLPVTRKEYVREKYLFGLLASIIPWGILNCIQIIMLFVKGTEFDFIEYLAASAASLPLVCLLLSLEIPIQLKFGAEKGRMAVFIAVGLGVAFAWIIGHIKDINDIMNAINEIFALGIGVLAALTVAILAVLVYISYQFSVRIMEKKQF